MLSSSDRLVELRLLMRKVSLWRALAIAALIILILGSLTMLFANPLEVGKRTEHIARLSIDGLIQVDHKQLKLIEELGEDEAVKAVIVSINSPGGTTTGGEALYEALSLLARKKPVVASIETLGTSAGYMVALATDRIYARRTSITGSIGVLFQYANVTQLMDKIGVDMEAIKSGPLKAEPSPFEPATQEVKDNIRLLVSDTYNWFVDLVAKERDIDPARIRALKGGVVTGHQALELKLIDALGGEKAIVQWLGDDYGITEETPIRDRRVKQDFAPWDLSASAFAGFWQSALDQMGLSHVKDGLGRHSSLDGLVSVWHPAL
jgi:protease-4